MPDCMAIDPAHRLDTETLYRGFTALDVGRKNAVGEFIYVSNLIL